MTPVDPTGGRPHPPAPTAPPPVEPVVAALALAAVVVVDVYVFFWAFTQVIGTQTDSVHQFAQWVDNPLGWAAMLSAPVAAAALLALIASRPARRRAGRVAGVTLVLVAFGYLVAGGISYHRAHPERTLRAAVTAYQLPPDAQHDQVHIGAPITDAPPILQPTGPPTGTRSWRQPDKDTACQPDGQAFSAWADPGSVKAYGSDDVLFACLFKGRRGDWPAWLDVKLNNDGSVTAVLTVSPPNTQ